jgi:hypothetical protein
MKSHTSMATRRAVALAIATVVIMPTSYAASDDFEAWRRQQAQGAQEIKKEFQEFKEKQDREFADFLKSQWRDFDTFQGKVRIKDPKPKQIPVAVVPAPTPTPAKPTPKLEPSRPAPLPEPPPDVVPVAPVVVTPILKPVPPPPPPPQPKPLPVAADVLELAFYGNAVNVPFDPRWKAYRLPAGDKPEAMSAFWATMSGSRYEPTVDAMNKTRGELKLDDWGHVALWRDVAQALQPDRRAEQNLLLWYFLVKSGYDVRLGYAASDVHLFVAVRQPVYSTKYTAVGKQTYYAILASDLGKSIGPFYTYEANYPVKLRALDLHAASTGFTKTVAAQRELAFEYKGKTVRFSVPYDRRLVQYMNTYPQTEFDLYFSTDGSPLLRQALLVELKKYTATMSEDEAADFLLAFVQKALAYKTDEEQFGYEKYFFVEESLHFPYADCEDRSVLYAWLVHELLGMKAIGLLYPGHMTTAIALKQPKPGAATVDHKGQQFVIADPTYIGASVGMPMPSYAKLKPERVVSIQ